MGWKGIRRMSLQLIVALDFDNKESALKLIDQLNPTHCALKVGLEMYTLFGPEFVRLLITRGFKVFLDLKFHDIPNTVARACKAGADLGVWMMNVHASGGVRMMKAAQEALSEYRNERPLLIAVTVLTSMDEGELPAIGVGLTMSEQVSNLAQLTQAAHLDGIVCSALETEMIKRLCGKEFLTVTPGIRLPEDAKDDQSRVITPEQAIRAGSDYLVVGRPITRSATPEIVVTRILEALTV
jgi:orotidine-5'-phosphate decarboxylase